MKLQSPASKVLVLFGLWSLPGAFFLLFRYYIMFFLEKINCSIAKVNIYYENVLMIMNYGL